MVSQENKGTILYVEDNPDNRLLVRREAVGRSSRLAPGKRGGVPRSARSRGDLGSLFCCWPCSHSWSNCWSNCAFYNSFSRCLCQHDASVAERLALDTMKAPARIGRGTARGRGFIPRKPHRGHWQHRRKALFDAHTRAFKMCGTRCNLRERLNI